MFINSDTRLAAVRAAERELHEFGAATPADPDRFHQAFYQTKIAAAWARAQAAPAYQKIGDFSWRSFTDLPVTAKEQIKSDPWSFVAAGVQTGLKYYETTGTTGAATPTPRLAEDIIWNTVSVAQAWHAVLGEHERVLNLLPSDIVPVGDLVAAVCEHLGLAHARAYPFATGICDWDRLISLWTTLRPTAVFLAPGVAMQLSRLLKQRGLLAELSGPVRSLMLLGEVSVPAMRLRLGRWWGATAYNASYGSTETGTLAATCPADRMHLLTAANYFELATGDRLEALRPGATGRLVATPLNLYARPLLRYDTGDEVAVSAGCGCGRPTPVVTVLGRASDGVRVRGATLSPHLVEEIVYGETTATGYQLETDALGSWFRLLLERDVDADREREQAAADAVATALRERADLRCDRVVFVNSLPSLTKSGGSQKSWKRSSIRLVEAAP